MAKIKKIETATLHISNKYASGAVHPRLQKHTRQALKPDVRADQKIAEQKLRERKQQLEKDIYKEKQSAKEKASKKKPEEKYDFPFDKGYQKYLEGEFNYSARSAKDQKAIAEESKYQKAYEAQSGKSYKDGSSLGGGGGVKGYSADYVKFLQNNIKGFNGLPAKLQQERADDKKAQSAYTNQTGKDPVSGNKVGGGSYTSEYQKWIQKNINPKDAEDAKKQQDNAKNQQAYTKQTGKNPKG